MTKPAGESENPYAPLRADVVHPRATSPQALKQSGLGIVSFGIGMASGLLAITLVVIAGMLEVSTPGGMDEESPQAILVGFGLFGVVAMNFLGLGLGFAGLVQPSRSRALAVLGLMANMLVVFGLCGLMALGLAMVQ